MRISSSLPTRVQGSRSGRRPARNARAPSASQLASAGVGLATWRPRSRCALARVRSAKLYFLVTIGDPLLVVPIAASVLCFGILTATRVVLYPDRVESGFRLLPKSIDRSNIVEVREGKVLWGRGYLTGVVVILHDGRSEAVSRSAPLSKRARRTWIASIEDWLERSRHAEV